MKKLIALALSGLLAGLFALGAYAQEPTRSVKQDVKDTAHVVKEDTKAAGRSVKKGVKSTAHAVKRGAKKAKAKVKKAFKGD